MSFVRVAGWRCAYRYETQQNPAEAGFWKKLKLTDKPGSVVDSHSSRPAIAHWLKQPTRVQYGPYHVNPYLALLRVEFTVPRTVTSRAVRSYRTLSPLPDPLARAIGGLLSVALVVGFPALRHPALWSPDFPPSARLPERDDDEAATVWSASARSIEGLRAAVTLRCGQDAINAPLPPSPVFVVARNRAVIGRAQPSARSACIISITAAVSVHPRRETYPARSPDL